MIKVAILGAGAIANTHVEAYLQFKDRASICAIVDIYPEKARSMAEKFGVWSGRAGGWGKLSLGCPVIWLASSWRRRDGSPRR